MSAEAGCGKSALSSVDDNTPVHHSTSFVSFIPTSLFPGRKDADTRLLDYNGIKSSCCGGRKFSF